MKEPEKTKNLVDQLINEPTVHFFVISVVVFIVYAISNLNGDDVIESDIQKNLKIVDLTGAGDLFAAGFLHGYINLSLIHI